MKCDSCQRICYKMWTPVDSDMPRPLCAACFVRHHHREPTDDPKKDMVSLE